MKKLILLCFLSIVAMLNSTTFAQDCCFWIEKNNAAIPEEVYSLNTPNVNTTDYYYIHFINNCGLDSLTTKVSLGWEIYRDGQLLDNGSDLTKLSRYADITFQVYLADLHGFIGKNVRSGLGNQYALANLDEPKFADFPGAIPNIGNAGAGYLTDLPNFQNYDFFYLHFLQHASRTNGIRMKVDWKRWGNYEIKFTLYSRACGTEIQYPYLPLVDQHRYVGGHQSNVSGIIAQFTLDPMPRGAHEDAICAGDIYAFGVQPDGTPYTYFANTAIWPNSVTTTYIVPSYTQPQPCYGPSVGRMDTLTLTVNPIPPVAIVPNMEICGEGDVTFTVTNTIIASNPPIVYRWYSDLALTNLIAEGNTATVSVLNPTNTTTSYNYYVVAYSEFCNSAPITVTVTSNPIPELALTPYNKITCPFIHTENVGVTTLPGSFTGNLTYAWTGATGTTDNALVNIIADCSATYTFSVLVTDAKGCSNTIVGEINAQDIIAPTVSPAFIVAASTSGCNLDSVPAPLDVNGLIAAGFTFTDNCTNPENGTNFTLASRDEMVTGCTNTLKRYYILYDYCGNASAEFYHEFNVIDDVSPTFTPNTNPYIAVLGTNCTFSISQEILDQIAEDFDPKDNCSNVTTTFSVEADQVISSTTEVVVTFSDACENVTTTTVMVTVPATLTSTITTTPLSLEACSGSSFTFVVETQYGADPITFTWSDTQLVGDSVVVTPVLDNIYVDQDFTYSVTVVDANACSSINTVTVKVHGEPEFTLTADHAICFGESTTLVVDYDGIMGGGDGDGDGEEGGEEGGPFYDPINVFVWSNGATTSSITDTPQVTKTYTVTVTSPYGCTAEKSVTVTVNPLPVFTATKIVDNTFCVGSNGAIEILPNDGTYNYFVGTTQIELPYTNLAPGTYTITAQNPTTLCTASALPITILNSFVLPVATIGVSPITEYCLYQPIGVVITATSTQPTNSIFTMTVNGVTLENVAGVASYTFTAAGTYTFVVTTTNSVTGCISAPVQQVVTIYPLPANPSLTANDTEICFGETVTLTATPLITDYTYTFNQNQPTALNTLQITPELIGDNIYSVIITTDHGCTATANVTVVVNPLPIIESISSQFDCPNVTPNAAIAIVTSGTAPYTYSWSGSGVTVDAELGTVLLNNTACNSSNIVTLTIVDAKGCTTTKTTTVLINDTIPPTIVFEGTISQELTVDCNSIPTQRTQDINVSDNCTAEIAIVLSMLPEVIIPGSCANSYDIERRWSAQDACGNIDTIMQLIHVVDVTKPVLTAIPANIAVSCDNIPVANLLDPALAATDNCSSIANITFTYLQTIGATAIANTYFIYRDWVAVDQCGNVSNSMRQTITVTDQVAPTLITTVLPQNLTLACSDIIPTAAVLEYIDNCEGVININFNEISTQGANANLSTYYNYTITRTWFATDAAGNSTPSITQVITVIDIVAPIVELQTVPQNTTVNCSEIPEPADVSFIDNCDEDLNITYTEASTQGTNPNLPNYYNYTITRTWFATDATGLVSPTVTQVIIVHDVTAPVVVTSTVPANITLNCQDVIPAPADVEFIDACDATPTVVYNQLSTQATSANTIGYYNYTITRTWSATDVTGNASSATTQVITVKDVTAPVVVTTSLPADITLTCSDEIPAVANVLFTDNCSTPIIAFSEITTFVNNPLNTSFYNYVITRTWIATDASNNVSLTATQVITIVDNNPPSVVINSIPEDVTVSCDNIPTVAPSFIDDCDQNPIVTLNQVSTQGTDVNLPTYYNYIITRTWFATDATGHVSPTVTQVITVQDITSPVVVEASVPANLTLNCQDAVPAAPTVQFTDNCDLNPHVVLNVTTTRGSNPAAASYYNYTITRTWFASDASGNVSEDVVQVVTVHDVTAPTFTFVPANITIFTTAACTYNATPAITGTATATDNCFFPVVSYIDELIQGANAGQWTINRTWKAQDLSGNFITALQVITVTDNTFPTFTVPVTQSVCRNIDGTYANLVTTDLMGIPTNVLDNCTTNPAVTYSDNITNIGNATTDGYITRTWTVTDEVGNATTATQNIAVLHRPVVTITGPNTICQGTTIILTGNGATGYVWNTAAITPSINVTEAGTYSVVGTIANGCSNSASITVTQFEVPVITSTVPDQICIGEVITLTAQAINSNEVLVNGDWSVQLFSGSTNTITLYNNVVGALVHTSIPVIENSHFDLTFTDANGCAYTHTTATTIVSDEFRLRLYTDKTAAPNNVLNVSTGDDAKFYIKVEACADLTRRAQIQFQVYKDGVVVPDLGEYLTDEYYSVSYFTDQNGIDNPNQNNIYYNPIANGTFPFANTAQYAPWNGFFVNWSTNAYNWFYMHFFKERFITVDIDAFTQPGQYTIVYNLVGAAPSCNITDNSTNYTSSLSYGGSGFQWCNNTILMATNTMVINVAGDPIPDVILPEPLPVPSSSMNVNVFPNPSNGESVRLSFQNIEGATSINVVSLNGKMLYEFDTTLNTNKKHFDLPNLDLAPGIYFIQVVNNKAVLTKKLIIQK